MMEVENMNPIVISSLFFLGKQHILIPRFIELSVILRDVPLQAMGNYKLNYLDFP
jgi:CRISPR/Cas system CSM-associated protein Csm4 (group 5 of RAMP superfamily)